MVTDNDSWLSYYYYTHVTGCQQVTAWNCPKNDEYDDGFVEDQILYIVLHITKLELLPNLSFPYQCDCNCYTLY